MFARAQLEAAEAFFMHAVKMQELAAVRLALISINSGGRLVYHGQVDQKHLLNYANPTYPRMMEYAH